MIRRLSAKKLMPWANWPEQIERLSKTLREHYLQKRAHYGVDHAKAYDMWLLRLFSAKPCRPGGLGAAEFLARIRGEVRRTVASWTGQYQYTIDQVIEDMIERCRALNLCVATPLDQAKLGFTVLLTRQSMNYLHSGRHRVVV